MDTTPHIEQFFLQSLIEDIDSSFHQEQEFPSFHPFTYNPSSHSSSPIYSSKTDNSTNSSSSSEETILPNAMTFPNLTLQNILTALTNQKLSIYLQKVVREMKPASLSFLLNELKGNFFTIMTDKNGNYLCTDIFKHCNAYQRQFIIKEIFPFIDDISIHEYGTHSIQTLIELSSTHEEAILLCSSLCNDIKMAKVALNPRGAYVIQKMLKLFPEEVRCNFNYFLMKIIHLLSIDIYGVCTVKQFALNIKNEKTIFQFLQIIYKHFFTISKNKYGNYLIQFILQLWWSRNEMFAFRILIEKSFLELSVDEYASHIAEIYVKMVNVEDKERIYKEIVRNGQFGYLVNNKYGMFVINKLVSVFK